MRVKQVIEDFLANLPKKYKGECVYDWSSHIYIVTINEGKLKVTDVAPNDKIIAGLKELVKELK